MKALVYHGNRDLRVQNWPDPTPRPGEALLRVDYCGICATDIEEYLYGPAFIAGEEPNPVTGKKMPMVTGHEITATVLEVNAHDSEVAPGDRVAINGVLTCGTCYWCTNGEPTQCPGMAAVGFGIDGGLAERLVWRSDQLVKIPGDLSSEEAALTEPTSVAIHAVKRSGAGPGDSVVVLGAGTVGLLAMQAAKAFGATVYAVDTRQMSLDLAQELGGDQALDASGGDAAETITSLTDGVGADIVIDTAGAESIPEQAVRMVRRGGLVVVVAIYTSTPRFDFNSLVATEVSMTGSLAYTQADMEDAVRLISSGEIRTRQLVTEIVGLDDVLETAFPRMLAPTKDVFRILVKPN